MADFQIALHVIGARDPLQHAVATRKYDWDTIDCPNVAVSRLFVAVRWMDLLVVACPSCMPCSRCTVSLRKASAAMS